VSATIPTTGAALFGVDSWQELDGVGEGLAVTKQVDVNTFIVIATFPCSEKEAGRGPYF
jgi:hypothetical protein